MNNLINLIIIWFFMYYGNLIINKINNPILEKISTLLFIILIQFIYEKFKNFFRKKDITNKKIIDRGVHRGTLVLLGKSILKDVLLLSTNLPHLINILQTNYGKTTFSLLPLFFTMIFKSLLQ